MILERFGSMLRFLGLGAPPSQLAAGLFAWLVLALTGASPAVAQSLKALTDAGHYVNLPAALSGDGSRVFYVRSEVSEHGETFSSSLLLRETGSNVPVTLYQGMRFDYILADQTGSRLVVGVHAVNRLAFASSRVFLFDVASRTLTDLLPVPFSTVFSDERIAFDGRRGLVYVSSYSGRTGLLAISLETGEIRTLAPGANAESVFVDSSEGVVYFAVNLDVYRLRPGEPEPELVFNLDHPLNSISDLYVSPGGGLLTLRTGDGVVFQHDVNSSSTRQLFNAGLTQLADVSRDGRRVLVESYEDLTGENADGSPEIFLCSIDGESCAQLTDVRIPGFRSHLLLEFLRPRGFLDETGSAALLASGVELPLPARSSTMHHLYRVDTSTRQFLRLDVAGYPAAPYSPQVLSDGAHVAFFTGPPLTQGGRFVIARLDGTDFTPVGPEARPWLVAYSSDASTIAFLENRAEGRDNIQQVRLFRAVDGNTRTVAELNVGPPSSLPNPPFPDPRQIDGLELDSAGETLVISSKLALRSQDPQQEGYLYRAQPGLGGWDLQLLAEGRSPRLSGDGRTLAWQARSHVFAGRLAESGVADVVDLGEAYLFSISQDGRRVVLEESGQAVLAGTNGGGRTVLTEWDTESRYLVSAQISAAGDRVAISTQDYALQRMEIELFDTAGNRVDRFEFPLEGQTFSWSLSPQADRVFFASYSPVLGRNPDSSLELFVVGFGAAASSIVGLPDPSQSLAGLSLVNREASPVTVQLEWLNGADPSSSPKPVAQRLQAGEQRAALLSELFPEAKAGTLRLRSGGEVAAYALAGSLSGQDREGIPASATLATSWLFPVFSTLQTERGREEFAVTLLFFNPGLRAVTVEARLSHSLFPSRRRYLVPPRGTVRIDVVAELTRAGASLFHINQGLLEVSSSLPIQARLELQSAKGGVFRTSLPGLEASLASDQMTFPFAAAGPEIESWVWLLNPGRASASFRIEARNGDGDLVAEPLVGPIQAKSIVAIPVSEFALQGTFSGSLHVTSSPESRLGGVLAGVDRRKESFFAYSPRRLLSRSLVAPFVVETEELFTSFAVANPYPFAVRYQVEVFDGSGEVRGTLSRWLPAYGQKVELLSGILGERQVGGHFRLIGDLPLSVLGLLGSRSGEFLAYLSP